jgi:hypothetical protein
MGLSILEKKFLEYSKNYPDNILKLKTVAGEIAGIQKKMRNLLKGITETVCSACSASCCSCMPVEGWFTEHDYFVFRLCYDAPFDLKVSNPSESNCAFLCEGGCALPEDMRPFPCVKVNCKLVNSELENNGRIEEFKRLNDDLGMLQKQIWKIINF